MHGGIIDSGDIHAFDEERFANARESFWDFRKLIHKGMLESWFQYDVSQHLQQFFADYRVACQH